MSECRRCEQEIEPADETDIEVAAGVMWIVHDVCPPEQNDVP